jgi:hypothetical protein
MLIPEIESNCDDLLAAVNFPYCPIAVGLIGSTSFQDIPSLVAILLPLAPNS